MPFAVNELFGFAVRKAHAVYRLGMERDVGGVVVVDIAVIEQRAKRVGDEQLGLAVRDAVDIVAAVGGGRRKIDIAVIFGYVLRRAELAGDKGACSAGICRFGYCRFGLVPAVETAVIEHVRPPDAVVGLIKASG